MSKSLEQFIDDTPLWLIWLSVALALVGAGTVLLLPGWVLWQIAKGLPW